MALEQTWRWFGPNDPVTLKEIRQTGATGIVTALHHVQTGEPWSIDEITARKEVIEAEGLKWSVAESLPVHEDIKRREGRFLERIENYKASIRNLGRCGVDTVCYNFMPVLDWSRTDLEVEFTDGSTTTKFEANAFAAFDLFVLKRRDAEKCYSEKEIAAARQYFGRLDDRQKQKLLETVLLGFPGSGEAYTLEELARAVDKYREIGEEGLREHLRLFLEEIIPVAEESGVLMAIHPDDPPWSLLGLPRIVSNYRDIERILAAVDSPSNGITLCTGSLGAGVSNNLVQIAQRFAHRVNFVHLRNVTATGEHSFVEGDHLDGNVDIYGVIKALLLEQKRRADQERIDRRMPMRPDHGRLMIPDKGRMNIYPGYSLFGRMRALAELRGLELGITRALGL